MEDTQHSQHKINRHHVIETSIAFLTKQVKNQRLHVANLLAKTGDTESYSYLQNIFQELEDVINEIGKESIDEIKDYYSNHN